MIIPSSAVRSKWNEYGPEDMCTSLATVKTDLKPIPFSPRSAYMRQRGKESRIGRTDEPAGRLFAGFGARADIAYSLHVVGRKAEFITLKYDEVLLNLEIQRRDDVIPVFVVVCVLYKLE